MPQPNLETTKTLCLNENQGLRESPNIPLILLIVNRYRIILVEFILCFFEKVKSGQLNSC